MGRIEKTVFISYRRTNLPWIAFKITRKSPFLREASKILAGQSNSLGERFKSLAEEFQIP